MAFAQSSRPRRRGLTPSRSRPVCSPVPRYKPRMMDDGGRRSAGRRRVVGESSASRPKVVQMSSECRPKIVRKSSENRHFWPPNSSQPIDFAGFWLAQEGVFFVICRHFPRGAGGQVGRDGRESPRLAASAARAMEWYHILFLS